MIMKPEKKFTFEDGQNWLKAGWELLKQFMGLWLLVMVIVGVVYMQLTHLPDYLFFVLVGLFSPLVTAGMYHACWVAKGKQQGGRAVSFGDFLVGFQKRTTTLIKLGVVLSVLSLLTHFAIELMLQIIGVELNPELPPALLLKNTLMAQLIGVVVSIPVLVLTLFAPQLVFFHQQTVLQSLQLSYAGFVAAWRALLMMALLVMALVFVIAFLGTFLSLLLQDLGALLMAVALILLMSANFCGQFWAFISLFPIDGDNDSEEKETHAVL